LITFAGTLISARQNAATQRTLAEQAERTQRFTAEQTAQTQKTIAEQTQNEMRATRAEEKDRAAELEEHHLQLAMNELIDKHWEEISGSDPKRIDVRFRQLVATFGKSRAEAFFDKLGLLRGDALTAVSATKAELSNKPALAGKVLVSDPLKHMWEPSENFGYLTGDDLDRPENSGNFLPREASRGPGAGGRLKKNGKYLAVTPGGFLSDADLRKNPWVTIRKMGTEGPVEKIPVLDRLPRNNNYPVEVSQSLADALRVTTNDSVEIFYP
jgi:hypothetical protein